MKLLTVTRERDADRRYGLGKSLAPLFGELEARGVRCVYLSLEQMGVRGVRWQRRLGRVLSRLAAPLLPGTDAFAVIGGTIQRLNMGRLAARYAAREGITHVHCHDPIIAAGYRWAARLTPGCRARWGVTEHGFGCYAQAFRDEGVAIAPWLMRRLRAWERRTLLAAHWVVTPTGVGRERLLRDLAIDRLPDHFAVIPHPRPPMALPARRAARAELGWAADGLYILAVGRLVALKRFDRLIEACAALPDRVRLVLLGDGEREALAALAEARGLGGRLLFAAADRVAPYYAAADLYVSTSATEAFGLANLEALGAGLPALCTAVGGVPEVVGGGGWLIGGDCGGLESALDTLVSDAEERRRWAERARARAAAWPAPAALVERWLALYGGETPAPFAAEPSPRGERVAPRWHETVAEFAPCPLPAVLKLPEGGRVVLFAPHPDDEAIGCGGTLARLRRAGCEITVVVVTDGAQGDPEGYAEGDVVAVRRGELEAALKVLGVEGVRYLDEPDGGYRHGEPQQARLEALLASLEADWLLLPSLLDYHRDHVAVGLSVIDAWAARGARERLFMYEVWAPLPATAVVDIAPVESLKREAMACYRLPHRYFDYSDYSLGLNRYRGAYVNPHGGLAEAFLELRGDDWRGPVELLLSLRRRQEEALAGGGG